jgi:hypothetical protein
MIRLLFVACAGVLLAGCSAQLVHTELAGAEKAGTPVDGIPYRVSKRYTAKVYEKTGQGYTEIHRQNVTLPDPDKVYVVGFKGKPFSSSTVEVVMNADSTLSQVSLKYTSTGQAAMTALSAQVNAVATAEATRRAAESTAATTAANTQAGLLIAADKAKQAAELAELLYKKALANPETTPDDLKKAQNAERSAKLDANEAARKAGKPAYFPDVVL